MSSCEYGASPFSQPGTCCSSCRRSCGHRLRVQAPAPGDETADGDSMTKSTLSSAMTPQLLRVEEEHQHSVDDDPVEPVLQPGARREPGGEQAEPGGQRIEQRPCGASFGGAASARVANDSAISDQRGDQVPAQRPDADGQLALRRCCASSSASHTPTCRRRTPAGRLHRQFAQPGQQRGEAELTAPAIQHSRLRRAASTA